MNGVKNCGGLEIFPCKSACHGFTMLVEDMNPRVRGEDEFMPHSHSGRQSISLLSCFAEPGCPHGDAHRAAGTAHAGGAASWEGKP